MKVLWMLLVALGLGTKRHWHILFAIILAIVLGMLFPGDSFLHRFFEFIGQIFIRLITMLVIPLVVSSVVVGVSSLGDARQLGRMGSKVLSWFIVLMSISALLGVGLGLLFEPGQHVQSFLHFEHSGLSELTPVQQQELADLRNNPRSIEDHIYNLIPRNPIESLARMELVPVILFTFLFGVALAFIGEAGKPLINLFEALFTATMKLTDWIMVLAVPGVFSLTFVTVSNSGLEVFKLLAPFIWVTLLGLLVQAFVIFPVLLRVVARLDWLQFYRAISEAMMVAFGTASSSATLPVTIACCERQAGISNRIASFVLPTGTTINKTGTTMFEVLAVLFLAQAYGVQLDSPVICLIVVFAIIASIGAAAVPSTGLITMGIVLNSMGEQFSPTLFGAGIAMLWSIDRVLDMCRTVVNITSSCTVAALVAASEGELNRDALKNQTSWTQIV